MLGAWCQKVPQPALIKVSRMREWRNPITIQADPGATLFAYLRSSCESLGYRRRSNPHPSEPQSAETCPHCRFCSEYSAYLSRILRAGERTRTAYPCSSYE